MFYKVKNKERGATFVEYAIVVAMFLGIFIFFGKLLSENSKNVAGKSHSIIAEVVPCVQIGDSEYLIGSKLEDREVCIE